MPYIRQPETRLTRFQAALGVIRDTGGTAPIHTLPCRRGNTHTPYSLPPSSLRITDLPPCCTQNTEAGLGVPRGGGSWLTAFCGDVAPAHAANSAVADKKKKPFFIMKPFSRLNKARIVIGFSPGAQNGGARQTAAHSARQPEPIFAIIRLFSQSITGNAKS